MPSEVLGVALLHVLSSRENKFYYYIIIIITTTNFKIRIFLREDHGVGKKDVKFITQVDETKKM